MDSQTIAQILQANGGKMTGSASGTSGKSSAQITSILQAAGGKPTGGSQTPTPNALPGGGSMAPASGSGVVAPGNENNLFGNGQNKTGNFLGVDTVNNAASGVLNAVTGSEQTFGKALSTIGSSAPGQADKINAQDNASKDLLLKAIHFQTDPAKKQHMMDAYQKIWGNVAPTTAGDINPAFNLSKEQVVGAAAGTLTDLASAGALPGGSSEAVSQGAKGGGIIQGAIEGAKAGAKVAAPLGAAYGVSQGLQENKNAAGVVGSGVTGAVAGAATGGIFGAVTGGISGGIANSSAIRRTTEALNPELTGKKLTAAYEKGALSGTIEEGGLLKPQTAGVSSETNRLATSLQDVGLRPGQPARNLVKLGNEMTATEAKITPFNDYGVDPGVKKVLSGELESLKASIPREFSAIKDNQNVYNDVVDFGKETINGAKDTIGGYRNARTSFDYQAKLEFPSAYDEKGMINLKTPAGRAIKAVRDTINENLYQIAPKNADLQGMISREADIYRAIHTIAPAAAKNEGLNAIQKLFRTVRKNPLATGVGLYAADKIVKGITGYGIPGL